MRRLLAIILIASPLLVKAQGQLGFYDVGGRIPQTSLLNPAFFQETKVSFAFPGLGSTSAFIDTDQLSFKRIFKKEGDSLVFVPENLTKNLKKRNRFEVGIDANLFFLGIASRNNFISISASTKSFTTMLMSRQAIEWALYGPADPRNENEALDLSDLGGSVVAYHEFSLGYARKLLNGRLSVGGRFKYLSGIVEGSVRDIKGHIYSGIDSLQIYNESFSVNTSGFSGFDSDAAGVILGFKNPGFALDLGAQFQITDQISVYASLIDLGFINWKDNLKSYEIDAVNYTFKGFDALDLINGEDVIQNEVDSLENLYDPKEIDGKSYRTPLVKKIYLGARYQFHKKQHVSLNIYNDYFEGHIKSAIGVNYGVRAGQVMDVLIGFAYRDRSIANFNFGTVFTFGPFQLYLMSENFSSLFWTSGARKFDVHFGMNFLFGKMKKGST